MSDYNQFYDMNGNELHVGDVVAVPLWEEKRLAFGYIIKLDLYRNRHHYNDTPPMHQVAVPTMQLHPKAKGAWFGSSIVKVTEADAVMARIRDFEPFQDDTISF